MTEFDLRLKYRRETGMPPTYGRTRGQQAGCNYRGALTHDYAEWLERNNDAIKARNVFKKHFAKFAIYYDNYRNLRYTREYKEWMEEQMCKTYTFIDILRNNESN